MMDVPITEQAIAKALARCHLGENTLTADKDTTRTGRVRWGKSTFSKKRFNVHQPASGVQPGWRFR